MFILINHIIVYKNTIFIFKLLFFESLYRFSNINKNIEVYLSELHPNLTLNPTAVRFIYTQKTLLYTAFIKKYCHTFYLYIAEIFKRFL